MYNVSKKDGTKQPFDKDKIINAVQKAGSTAEIGLDVAQKVEEWLPEANVHDVIAYTDIRYKVLSTLRELDTAAADKFEEYIKSTTK